MEKLLYTMLLLSPVGMAIISCFSIGLALVAREALGKERGLRAAAESARDAAVKTLSENKNWEMQEIGRFRRLLECHGDSLVAEATDFLARPSPSPGAILGGLCSWNHDWKRQLAAAAGMSLRDVEKLLKDDLPITPAIARKLEMFTNAPARFWERLWWLHDAYRAETDQTVRILVDRATRARASKDAQSKRPVLQIVGDSPTVAEPAPTVGFEPPASVELPPVLQSPPCAPRPARPELPARSPVERSVTRNPPLRIPLAPPGQTAQERAGRLMNFPIQGERIGEDGGDWSQVDSSALSTTLPGVGKSTP